MGEILAPVERRAKRLQLLAAQFVIQLGWIAALHASERSFRKCSLDLHDSLCFGHGGFWLIAPPLEHPLDVDQIFLPHLLRFIVIFQAVVAIPHSYPSLVCRSNNLS